MTKTLLAPASPPPVLDLDARLACVDAFMAVRLDKAAVAFEIRTAHIQGADPVPDVDGLADVAPLTPQLAPPPCPYSTPLAALLHRAKTYIETYGLNRGHLRDENGPAYGAARCPIGAIRIEADNRDQADNACALLDELIRRDFPDASIPSWVDAQPDPQLVLRYLDQAAQTAHSRNL